MNWKLIFFILVIVIVSALITFLIVKSKHTRQKVFEFESIINKKRDHN